MAGIRAFSRHRGRSCTLPAFELPVELSDGTEANFVCDFLDGSGRRPQKFTRSGRALAGEVFLEWQACLFPEDAAEMLGADACSRGCLTECQWAVKIGPDKVHGAFGNPFCVCRHRFSLSGDLENGSPVRRRFCAWPGCGDHFFSMPNSSGVMPSIAVEGFRG